MTWIYVLKVNDNDIERMLVGKIPSKCEKKDKLKILKKTDYNIEIPVFIVKWKGKIVLLKK